MNENENAKARTSAPAKRKTGGKSIGKEQIDKGILYSSGMIAGEGLVGILLAVLAVVGVDKAVDISSWLNLQAGISDILSLVVFALMILCLLKFTIWKKRVNIA